MVVLGASVHALAAQAAAVVWLDGAVQFPSLPMYCEQVVLVPVYEEHDPKVVIHPAPVVTHPV